MPLAEVESVVTGDLLSRATTDTDRFNESIRQAVPRIALAAITLVFTAAAILLTSPLLVLGLLAGVPFAVLSTWWYRPRATRVYERLLAQEADVLAVTHETARGAATVEALGLGPRQVQRHGAAVDRVVRTRQRTTWLQTVWFPSLDLATMVPMALTLLIGGLAYQRGAVGIGELTAVVLYMQALGEPLNDLLTWTDELQIGNAALRRILGVGRLPHEEPRSTAATEGHAIRLEGVGFGYGSGREVLSDVDLDIRPGERLAVVGASGAGKSTLGKLLVGAHHPTRGTVRIGGAEISTLLVDQLRREIVLVTQEQHVFTGMVRDNLTLAREEAPPDERLWEALETVLLMDWARAPRRPRQRDRPGRRSGVLVGGPAAGPGPAAAVRPARTGPGRGHGTPGLHRIPPGRAFARSADRGPHGDLDRAPPGLGAGRRPHRGHGPWPDRRARQPRGTPGGGRCLRVSVALLAGGPALGPGGMEQTRGRRRSALAFSSISPHFRRRRHLMTALDHRTDMTVRFAIWDQATRRCRPTHHRLNTGQQPGPPHPDTPSGHLIADNVTVSTNSLSASSPVSCSGLTRPGAFLSRDGRIVRPCGNSHGAADVSSDREGKC
ncbi:ABC transporter ATP-binding protein [Streptomyces sp. NPDC058770]|uniref:ABC transporter ATP-binding protein n=1 Tax=Streptomyces sp. NPDC058770 TaxID=3346631 RepID=UPI0036869648